MRRARRHAGHAVRERCGLETTYGARCKLWRHFFAFFFSLVWASLNYVRLGGGVCRAVTFFTVQSLVKATIYL